MGTYFNGVFGNSGQDLRMQLWSSGVGSAFQKAVLFDAILAHLCVGGHSVSQPGNVDKSIWGWLGHDGRVGVGLGLGGFGWNDLFGLIGMDLGRGCMSVCWLGQI